MNAGARYAGTKRVRAGYVVEEKSRRWIVKVGLSHCERVGEWEIWSDRIAWVTWCESG